MRCIFIMGNFQDLMTVDEWMETSSQLRVRCAEVAVFTVSWDQHFLGTSIGDLERVVELTLSANGLHNKLQPGFQYPYSIPFLSCFQGQLQFGEVCWCCVFRIELEYPLIANQPCIEELLQKEKA